MSLETNELDNTLITTKQFPSTLIAKVNNVIMFKLSFGKLKQVNLDTLQTSKTLHMHMKLSWGPQPPFN